MRLHHRCCALKIEVTAFYFLFRLELLFIPYTRELWVIFLGEVEMEYAPRSVAARRL
jgi:hypothetical protein